MPATIDSQQISLPPDLPGLNGVLRTLVGQPFLFLRESYADEMKAHFGTQGSYKHPKLAGLPKGSHIVKTRASRWQIDKGDGNVPLVGEEQPALSPGVRVVSAEASPSPDGYILSVRLADGSALVVRPDPDPQMAPDEGPIPWQENVGDWELLTPTGSLRVGPGLAWSWEPLVEKPSQNGEAR
jgi:hypothetical protein